jgi:hypothetical protein
MEKTIFNPAAMDLGMKLGKEVGMDYLNSANKRFTFLKPYFEIDNQYIFTKIKLLLFPFLYKDPQIGTELEGESVSKDRIDFADLYLPTLSFMTYILLVTLNVVFNGDTNFHPDILGYKASKNFTILVICSVVFKLRK